MTAMNLDFNHMILSQNTTCIDSIQSLLGKSKHPSITETNEVIQYLNEQLPNILVLDFESYPQPPIALITAIRDFFPMANIPIIAITPDNFETSQNDVWSQLTALNIVQKQDVDSSLVIFAEMIMDEYFTLDYRNRPHPYTLHMVSRIWRTQESCILLFENNRKLEFHQGAVRSPQDLSLLSELLLLSPPIKLDFNTDTIGNWLDMGELLFQHTQIFCKSGFLRFRKWLRVDSREFSEQIKDLPLPIHTRKLLFSTNSQDSLLKRIRTLSLRITQIEKDLEALYKLQLIHFEFISNVEGITQNDSGLPHQGLQIPKERWTTFLHSNLHHEWQKRMRLDSIESSIFNPWLTFHWNPKQELCAQVQETKRKYQVFEELTDPVSKRKLNQLQEYLSFLEQDLKKWQHLYQVHQFPIDLNDESNFYQALHYYRHYQFSKAFDILDADRTAVLTPLFKGWLFFCCQPQENAREGLILLEPYLEQHSSPWIHCWAAIMQMHLQHWKGAEQRLLHVLEHFNSEQVRHLYWMAQKRELPPQSTWLF